MKRLDLVTVVIPTYSRPVNLMRAIKSVLNQTYKNIEIIVVDDNGLDTDQQRSTYRMIEELVVNKTIKYIAHTVNKNGSAARNTGLDAAKGKFICFLDDDDIYLPTKIEKQVDALSCTTSTVGGAFCSCCNYKEDKNGHVIYSELKKNKFTGNLMPAILDEDAEIYYGTSKWMMKTEVCRELNGFDPNFRRHQDLEFLIRFSRKFNIISVAPDEALMKYDITDIDNRINPKTLFSVKELLFKKYENDVVYHNAHSFVSNAWFNVFLVCLRYGDIKLAFKAYRKARGHRITLRTVCLATRALVKCILINIHLL